MHDLKRAFARVLAVATAISFTALPLAQAQLENTPQSLNAQATDLMKNGRWGDALTLLNTVVERWDKSALQLFGPAFGVTWYRKGICEMQLQKFEDAMASFEACYKRYPNDSAEAEGGGNIFNKRALLRWGEAAQGAEEWETAVRMYKKFLDERDRTRDAYNPGSLAINFAICYFKMNQIPQGIEQFQNALKNKEAYKTPDSGIVAAFQGLVEAVIDTKDEKSLIDFINNNRADIIIEPYDMEPYSKFFLQLAAKAYKADMEKITFALYQLIPATRVMLDDVNARLAHLGKRPGVVDGARTIRRSTLEEAANNLKESISQGDPNEVYQLSATAFLHERVGNVRGAYACYEQLEISYPKSKKRENHLYNLVRTSSIVGEVMATEKYGLLFLKTYPDSEFVPAIRRLMLTSLFYNGEYESCIEIASEMLPKLSEGTKEHDICLYVLAGSYYYTGQFAEAQPLLDKHVELYPESQFIKDVLYFQASNLTRLQYWSKGAMLLDAYLKKFPEPENIYLPFALYDRANCHYALDEMDQSLTVLNRLEKEFPSTEVIDQAYNLKGNVLQTQADKEQAEEYYKKALEIAERRSNDLVASESLYYLVSLLGAKPAKEGDPNRYADAVPYADRFWKKYADSPYKAQMAVAEVYALKDAGRGEEAINRLRDVIAELADAPGAVGLEEAIGSFTEIYLEDHTPEQLKDLYYNFPGIKASNQIARALFRIALIGVYEEQAKKATQQDQKLRAQAGIKVLFTDLKNEFDVKDLSNFILVKVGDFIRGTNSPREALPYYDEALTREQKDYRFPALFGRAAVLAGGTAAEKDQAIKDFERILSDAEKKEDKDKALYQMVLTQMDLKQYAKAKDNAMIYLDPQNAYTGHKPEVAMALAQAYDNMGEAENALAAFNNVANTYKGMLAISAPATLRVMQLSWDRNSTGKDGISDRQKAYNAGRTYLDLTRRIIDTAVPGSNKGPTEEEVADWRKVEALTQQYADTPGIKTKEQQDEEARRKR